MKPHHRNQRWSQGLAAACLLLATGLGAKEEQFTLGRTLLLGMGEQGAVIPLLVCRQTKEIKVKGKDLLRVSESITDLQSGTDTHGAIDRHYDKHDRVIVITDEQPGYNYWSSRNGDVFANIPANVPTFTWNLAGYRTGHSEIKVNRYTFGGLTDKGFQMIPLLETGLNQGWPWENDSK